MQLLSLVLISYIIGSFSSAYVVGRLFRSIDIRQHGSGNSGSTNALRVMGFRAGLLTFILDFLKGLASAYIGYRLLDDRGQLLGGFFAVVGHNWPIFLEFKGGKGVATSLGVYAFIDIRLALIGVLLGLIVALTSKYVSLGSLVFLISFPVTYIICRDIFGYDINIDIFIYSIVIGLMGIIRHRSNIERLVNGKENKIKVGGG